MKINSLKMKDFTEWDVNETHLRRGDEIIKPKQEEVVIKQDIKVTCHRIDLFKDMFKKLFQD
jgi:hypothetical protein